MHMIGPESSRLAVLDNKLRILLTLRSSVINDHKKITTPSPHASLSLSADVSRRQHKYSVALVQEAVMPQASTRSCHAPSQ